MFVYVTLLYSLLETSSNTCTEFVLKHVKVGTFSYCRFMGDIRSISCDFEIIWNISENRGDPKISGDGEGTETDGGQVSLRNRELPAIYRSLEDDYYKTEI